MVGRVLDWFGERVLWGSDLPVLSAAGDDYGDWLATTRALTAGLSDDARTRLMGGAARAFYGV